MIKKKIYFISDTHLGSASHTDSFVNIDKGVLGLPQKMEPNSKFNPGHDIERKLCRWFDFIKADAKAVYLLGDIFDFWFEYKYVVPRGFTRVLGKIAEFTDSGIEVHFFIGNHDIWITDYLQKETGMIVHTEPMVCDFNGQKFFLAHGDGLGDDSKSFKIIRSLFHSRICQRMFAAIHPRWGISLAHKWSNHSRSTGGVIGYLGEEKEYLVQYAKKHLKVAANINYFVFGHRHIMLDLMIAPNCRIIILGDWITMFSYAVFDGEKMNLEIFEE